MAESSSIIGITGAGIICAAGKNLETTLDALFQTRGTPAPPRHIEIQHDTAYPVFEVPDEWVTGPCTGYNRCGALLVTALNEALANAGLSPADLRNARVGLCIGTVVGSALPDGDFYRRFHEREMPQPGPALDFLRSNPAALLQRHLGVRGPFQTVTNACSSGAMAIAEGASWIRAEQCDIVIAGGVDVISHLSYNGFIVLRITDEHACRPFDRRRNGLNLGEGAGLVVLESSAHARLRAVLPRFALLAEANASDAYHLSRPRPDGLGLRTAIGECLLRGNLATRDLAFVNAHGTATRENDLFEGLVLADMLPGTPFFSSKGYTGHTLGAAGAIEAIVTAACLERGRIPASAGFEEVDPDIGITPLTRPESISSTSAAISTSVGYGGSNLVLALGGPSHVL